MNGWVGLRDRLGCRLRELRCGVGLRGWLGRGLNRRLESSVEHRPKVIRGWKIGVSSNGTAEH